jgi:hypothetical protein
MAGTAKERLEQRRDHITSISLQDGGEKIEPFELLASGRTESIDRPTRSLPRRLFSAPASRTPQSRLITSAASARASRANCSV